MLSQAQRTAILELHAKGVSRHEISRVLQVSRPTVRKIVRSNSPSVPEIQRPEKAEPYREQILELLNTCKGNLVRVQKGELRQRYREGQEDQLGALGLVVNALVLWTTRYMDAALTHLRAQGVVAKPEDVARLSPLASRYFNVLGRYHFAVTDEAVRRGELRPLRNPNVFEQEFLTA